MTDSVVSAGAALQRSELLLGSSFMARLARLRVIVFGVGGVGSWCVEALVRNGVGHVTIVDSDRVCISNVNRQLMATLKTIGQPKVEALKDRLQDINPQCDVVALQKVYSADTAEEFDIDSYDYVVDAIDSLKDKAHLILRVCRSPRAKLFSSMGAALKLDPSQIRTVEFWDAKGCPLARALRKKFKHEKTLPAKKFMVVFSPEVRDNVGATHYDSASGADGSPAVKAQANGSLVHITGVFGFMIAGLVMQDVCASLGN